MRNQRYATLVLAGLLSFQKAVRRGVLWSVGLLWMVGCGGGDGTTPPSVPDVAGVWIGTETVEIRSGDCGQLQSGARTGRILDITQDAARLSILLLVNCISCNFSGTIAEDGAFLTTASTQGGGSISLTGQVTGNRMTARREPSGISCRATADYDLTLE